MPVVRKRQHVAGDRLEPLTKHAREAISLHRIVEPRVERIDVDGQFSLAPHVIPGIFERRHEPVLFEPEEKRDAAREALGVRRLVPISDAILRRQGHVVPQGHAVVPKVTTERPARKLLARVPLALPVEQKPFRLPSRVKPAQERVRDLELAPSERGDVPLGGVWLEGAHERRLASHREPHIARPEIGVDAMSELDDAAPLFVGVRFRDPRHVVDARHRHVKFEVRVDLFGGSLDRRRRPVLGSAGERDVPFGREQT